MRGRFGRSARRIGVLIQKEMIQLWRDWRTLILILSLPLIELFLFAYAVNMTVDHIPTAVADMSLDARSQDLIDALVVSGYFDVKMYSRGEDEVVRAIDEGRVKAGVVIPPDFGAQVERGDAQALIVLDGSDSFTVKAGYSAASAIAQDLAVKWMVQKVDRLGAGTVEALPVASSVRVLYNPDMDDLIFVLPGVVGILLQVMSIGQAAISVVRDRELGTMEQILATPVRPVELIVGKMIPNILLSVADLSIIVSVGIFMFGVPFQGDPWLFVWLSLLFIVSGLGLGLLVSTVTQTQKQAQQITIVLMMLSMMLTGLIYPRTPMPRGVQLVGNLIPTTYYIRIARGIITKGVGLEFLWSDLVSLAVYAIVVLVFAALTFKKRLD
jgi:ABC-2 type transport system permease protein